MTMEIKLIGFIQLPGGKLRLVVPTADGGNEQYDVANKDELWNDVQSILADTNVPFAQTAAGALEGDVDVVADACDRIGELVGERYGGLAGRGTAEIGRRAAPFLIKGLRHISKRKRFG